MGEEYSPAHGVRFMSSVWFIAALSEDADGRYWNLLSRDWPPETRKRLYELPVWVAGHELLANKPTSMTCYTSKSRLIEGGKIESDLKVSDVCVTSIFWTAFKMYAHCSYVSSALLYFKPALINKAITKHRNVKSSAVFSGLFLRVSCHSCFMFG